jgi:hypothetical protein
VKTSAKERRERQWAEWRQERELERQQQRDEVIREFSGDVNSLADEILWYRHCVTQIADAIGWTKLGAPFIALGPGAHWKPGDRSSGS